MSFPILSSYATTIRPDPGTTTIAVNMPATVNADDRLVCFASTYKANGSNQPTAPGGWTTLAAATTAPANGAIFHKVATGSEGGTTENFTLEISQTCVFLVIAVDNQNGIESTAGSTGLNANSNSASLSPSWGAEDTMWITVSCYADDDGTVTSYPSGYTGGLNIVGGGGTNNSCCIGFCYRNLNAASEDPGAIVLSETERWRAWTVAIRTNNESSSSTTPVDPNLSGVGTLTNSTALELARAPALSGVGTLAATRLKEFYRTKQLVGVGTLVLTRSIEFGKNIQLGGIGTLSLGTVYIPNPPNEENPNISGVGTLSLIKEVQKVIDIGGSGSLEIIPPVETPQTINMSGVGTLALTVQHIPVSGSGILGNTRRISHRIGIGM